MKRVFISIVLLLVVLSACNSVDSKSNQETESNYYLSMSDESEHWKLSGYEIMITSEGYKAGNGILKMKDADKRKEGFLSYDVYAVGGGDENRFHGGSMSGIADIDEVSTGTIDGERELNEFPKIDEIYMTVTWSDADTDGDQKEKIILYNKEKSGESFLDSE